MPSSRLVSDTWSGYTPAQPPGAQVTWRTAPRFGAFPVEPGRSGAETGSRIENTPPEACRSKAERGSAPPVPLITPKPAVSPDSVWRNVSRYCAFENKVTSMPSCEAASGDRTETCRVKPLSEVTTFGASPTSASVLGGALVAPAGGATVATTASTASTRAKVRKGKRAPRGRCERGGRTSGAYLWRWRTTGGGTVSRWPSSSVGTGTSPCTTRGGAIPSDPSGSRRSCEGCRSRAWRRTSSSSIRGGHRRGALGRARARLRGAARAVLRSRGRVPRRRHTGLRGILRGRPTGRRRRHRGGRAAEEGRGRGGVPRGAPARAPRSGGGSDGVLSLQQRGGDRGGARWRRRTGGRRRL